MIRKELTSLEKLDRLTDTIVDDILNMSDEEIVAEATEQFDSPSAAIEEVQGLVQSAILAASKAKLVEARAAVSAYKKESGASNVLGLSAAKKKEVIDRFIKGNPGQTDNVMLLAARKSDGVQSENDIASMFSDLIELGLIDEQGNSL